jgi:hypothetical protein
LAELREMARGIHPPILTEEGLEAALAFLAERSPGPVQVKLNLRPAPRKWKRPPTSFVTTTSGGDGDPFVRRKAPHSGRAAAAG